MKSKKLPMDILAVFIRQSKGNYILNVINDNIALLISNILMCSIAEVIVMLKKFKASGTQRENDIFACMITNLFDEYRFFSKYPEKVSP